MKENGDSVDGYLGAGICGGDGHAKRHFAIFLNIIIVCKIPSKMQDRET